MGDFDWDSDFRRMQAREGTIIRDLAFEAVAYQHAALEEMVERSLTAPDRCGIAIVLTKQTEFTLEPDADGVYRAIEERHYRLDPNIPFGHIYEFPSLEAYQVWQEDGCPPPV